MKYPYNPNGSLNGSNGFTNEDGRITILMPHPERFIDPILSGSDGSKMFESLLS